jgi:hypothetical protein
MRSLLGFSVSAILAGVAVAGMPPHRPYHLLLGPYEYERGGKHVPRYFDLDGRRYITVDALEGAVAALPPHSTIYLRGSCMPYDTIELPPRAISLADFRGYCRTHQVSFTWTFGPGGY